MQTLTTTGSRFTWNPADYAAHSASQQAWAREMMARLHLRGDEHILDVGCGDGKVTAELARAVPRGLVLGIDASEEMIRFARSAFPQSAAMPMKFHVMDARQLHLNGSFDVVFSNAVLHWVDDHQAFLRGASAALRRGGRLMVSCGGKGNAHEVFEVLRGVMRLARWRTSFRNFAKPYFFYGLRDYEHWLPGFGFGDQSVRLAEKDTTWDGGSGLAAWLRTTWLPYTQRVPEPLREEFIAAVVERYLAKHPLDASGRVHVRMVRLEIEAAKA